MAEELKKIMYIEDDDDIAELVTMALEDLGGMEVSHFNSGKQAIEKLSQMKPQLILMDVMMPDLDGPSTLKIIKEMPEHEGIPIIFMTARVQKHEIEDYYNLGAISVITKPFDPLTLVDQLTHSWETLHEEKNH